MSPNRAHSDLWRNIAELLRTTDLEVQIIKVVSHCCVTAATNAEEEWVYWHNRLTDQAAAVIKDKRSPEFWTAWKNLAAALTSRRCLHQAILLMLLKQSRLANVNKPIDVSKQPRVNPGPVVVMPAAPREWILPEKLFRRYGQSNVEAIHRWWSACGKEVLSGRGELRLVAGLQLFLISDGPQSTLDLSSIESDGLQRRPTFRLGVWSIGVIGRRLFCCFGSLTYGAMMLISPIGCLNPTVWLLGNGWCHIISVGPTVSSKLLTTTYSGNLEGKWLPKGTFPVSPQTGSLLGAGGCRGCSPPLCLHINGNKR